MWSKTKYASLFGPVVEAYGRRALPLFLAITCFFLKHFEELQTVLFEVELIINNKPLTYAYPKTIDINCS